MTGPLNLSYGKQSWALDVRPITIGRLDECDVVLEDDTVSRCHAYLVPTPDGPILIDRSRHGTSVNGTVRHGPSVLTEGDELCIGSAVLQIRRSDKRTSAELSARTAHSGGAKIRNWIRRYGPSEICGTITAVVIAGLVKQTTGSTVAAAYLATISEIVVFYGIMFLRESIREAHQAGRKGRSFGGADMLAVIRNLGLEFGAAELLDSGLLRPLFLGLGIQFIGGPVGVLAGKLVADLAFYGPVLAVYEWRLARHRAVQHQDRHRRTTSAGMPVPPE